MAGVYRIRNWNETYETAETRKLERLRWVPVPNKHDGLGYRRIVAQKDGVQLFAAWVLLLEVASKGPKAERGILARDGKPLTPEGLALMTGFPAAIFHRAFDFFTHPEQRWLELCENTADPASPGESPGTPADAPGTPVLNGMEGNGREGNGKTLSSDLPAVPDSEEDGPPTADDFAAAWNRHAQRWHLPAITLPLTTKRRMKADLRLREHPDPDWWTGQVFGAFGRSRFLRGETGWKPSFDWLCANGENCLKVAEGGYDDTNKREARR